MDETLTKLTEMSEKDEPLPGGGAWRKVDPKIWAPGTPTKLYTRILRRLRGIFALSSIWTLIILGPLSVLLTIWGTSYLVSPSLLGPTLILVWSALIGGFILVVEKTGYARNFEGSDFKLTKERLLAPALVLGVLITVFYFVTFVANKP
ncbi:MAG TPA: hypothetical protein VJL56_00580 [Candidatus Bathyarchaeia archaeon]|nr:hypothetical protein [Candidatus Bathyarchaeia archaeon]